jgi:GTP pyrophosphokinase
LDQPDTNALEFLDEFKLNLFTKEIRVFTPKGYMRILPKGATVLDFAYDIHTEIGDTCIGAKVNHKLVPMSHKLSSGDQIEILTSDKQKPQKEWLDFVVTAKARSHIKATFKKIRKEFQKKGVSIYEEVVKKMSLPLTSETLNKLLTAYKLTNRDDLFVEIGKQAITEENIEKILRKKTENRFIKYWKLQFLWNGKDDDGKKKLNEGGMAIDVDSDFTIAPCCNPIPGDDVVGMNIAGTKVIIHKRSCQEAIRLMASFGDKIVPVKWVSHTLMSFLAVIKITGIDAPGIVSEITAVITQEKKVNMRMIHFETQDGIFKGMIHLYVHHTQDLNDVVARIARINGIENVVRLESEG